MGTGVAVGFGVGVGAAVIYGVGVGVGVGVAVGLGVGVAVGFGVGVAVGFGVVFGLGVGVTTSCLFSFTATPNLYPPFRMSYYIPTVCGVSCNFSELMRSVTFFDLYNLAFVLTSVVPLYVVHEVIPGALLKLFKSLTNSNT